MPSVVAKVVLLIAFVALTYSKDVDALCASVNSMHEGSSHRITERITYQIQTLTA